MDFRKIGFLLVVSVVAGTLACATPPPPAPAQEAPSSVEEGPKACDMTFTSNPPARGRTIEVAAGNSVSAEISCANGKSITATGLPEGAKFEDKGSTASFNWKTRNKDARSPSHRVTFNSDNGGQLVLTFVVLMSK
ncbi:MAG: hypothetical protein OEY64_09645 [Nitrospinota bacterium]|nr:hypothetical protein [Nitrospinota bacterium]